VYVPGGGEPYAGVSADVAEGGGGGGGAEVVPPDPYPPMPCHMYEMTGLGLPVPYGTPFSSQSSGG
jgi:hypothetical protein